MLAMIKWLVLLLVPLNVLFSTFSCEDLVNFVKPQRVLATPDASHALFFVRESSIERNCCFDTLYHTNSKLLSVDEIIDAVWHEESLYLLLKDQGKHYIYHYTSKSLLPLIESEEPITHFCLSNKCIYYICMTKHIPLNEEGYVYDWQKDTSLTIFNRSMIEREIRCFDLHTKNISVVAPLPKIREINEVKSSLDGRFFLLLNRLSASIWDMEKKSWSEMAIEFYHACCWLDGHQWIYQDRNLTFWISGSPLDWLKIQEKIIHLQWNSPQKILIALTSNNCYKIHLDTQSYEKEELPKIFKQKLSLDSSGRYIGYIHESIHEPPEIAVYDFENKQNKILTNLNPQLDSKKLGKVEEMHITTKSGIKSKGYLLHPVDEEPGRRYPIIIATYGFSGKFMVEDWHTTFPGQVLAGKGYVILFLNYADRAQKLRGDWQKAQQIEGYDVVELFEQGLEDLVERGIGDPEKVGLYGWSHGGFIVNFLITHSRKFHVACLGEGGIYSPSSFWLFGMDEWTKIHNNLFGGPPWGETLKNYLDFSPFFLIDKIHTPLLMEFGEAAPSGLEMHIPLRYSHIPSELVIYDDEHNFVKPKARVASMKRKVDWFDYWLLDKRDPASSKKSQYDRWDAMRDEWLQN